MDDLSYIYDAGSNRLKRVTDAQAKSSEYTVDIDSHLHDYEYDAIGNLVKDL